MMRVQPATLGVSMGVVALVAAVVSPRGTTPEPKIPLCHATASLEHPYNLEDVDGDAIVLPDGEPTAHGTHTGPVYPAAGWGDIIPPFPYANASGGTSIFPGVNWTQYGEAVWNAGCDVTLVEPGPEEPSTTLPVPTTTVPKESTTTTEPSTTTTTSPTTTTSEQLDDHDDDVSLHDDDHSAATVHAHDCAAVRDPAHSNGSTQRRGDHSAGER